MIEAPATSSTQFSVGIFFRSGLSSSSLINITDSQGKNLVTFKPVRNIYYIIVSCPEFANGSSYSVYTGGSSTGTNTGGIYPGGVYSGGTLRKTFTISGKITGISI